MTRHESRSLCNGILEAFRAVMAGKYYKDSIGYFITDTCCVDISVGRDALDNIEYWDVSVFQNGVCTACTEIRVPVKDTYVLGCVKHALYDGLPKDIPIDLSLCGISRPVVDETIYRMAGLSLDYIYSSCRCVPDTHLQLLKEAVLSCVLYEE